jgi:hypothetical protein
MDNAKILDVMDEFGVTSLLSQRKVPLDHDLLSTLVSDMLALKSPTTSMALPVFRIQELLTIAQRIRSTQLNEIRLVESLLALYTLCLYYSTETILDAEVVIELVTLLQYISIESLVVENNNRRLQCLELLNPLQVFRKDPAIDTHFKLEIFSEQLDIAKAIVRDTLSLSRSLQKLKTIKAELRKRNMPKHAECIQPYCIHFLTNLALCHITSLMHQVGNLVFCPGCVEYLLMEMLTTISDKWKESMSQSESVASNKSVVKSQKAPLPPPYDLVKCITAANSLAKFVGHYALSQSVLAEVCVDFQIDYCVNLISNTLPCVLYSWSCSK